MSIWFFTDPHIGTVRNSHTTVQSRAALKFELFRAAARLIETTGSDFTYCLGDLFDTETNDEGAISQGLEIANRCRLILGGNHDLPNREGKLSSLQLLDQAFADTRVVCGSVDEPGFQTDWSNEARVVMVPHMATQELFEQSLDEAQSYTKEWEEATPRILCLHCNYDSSFIHNDASLNLTKEKANKLLETFDYILLGHEHQHRTLHGGRLIILGNTHPTSFSDISDKYIWEFRDGSFQAHPLWSKADGYMELGWDEFDKAIPGTVQFIEVTGKAPAERLPDVARNVASLWKNHSQLLMVRNRVESTEIAPEIDVALPRSIDLPSRISTALANSDLLPIWEQYKEAAQ